MPARWTIRNIPDLTGKIAIVTGANSGLGFEVTRALARNGARVIMACRNADKASQAAALIQADLVVHSDTPPGSIEIMSLDLSDLASIRRFAENFSAGNPTLDILCNNAGVMFLPYRQTADGFEMQLGTNHLGHFALTGLLLPMILKTPQARIVTMSSFMHRVGRINFADLHSSKRYSEWAAYGQSKLANLLFAYELQRKFIAHHTAALSLAAHPGYSSTNLLRESARMRRSTLMEAIVEVPTLIMAQSAARGALPMLYAATAPNLVGGEYLGPDGLFELWGNPKLVQSTGRSYDQAAARQLWDVSEQLTGVAYEPIFAASAP